MVTSLLLAVFWGAAAARMADAEARSTRQNENVAYASVGWTSFGPAAPALRAQTNLPDFEDIRALPVRQLAESTRTETVAEPVEQDFAAVTVVDGRTLDTGRFRIQLADVELPGSAEMCRLPSGRAEPCTSRAKTQLELQVRWRSVTCRYVMHEPTLGSGTCRIGSTGLSERLLAARGTWNIPAPMAQDNSRSGRG